jgi:tetratricopeptide (TPR) repeat protein
MNKILLGKASVEQIGSARVAEDANPQGVVSALETARRAQEFSMMAKKLWKAGRLEEAVQSLGQSVVLEESNGNLYGVVSDLGNIATIYRDMHRYGDAEDILVWLRTKDEQLIEQPTAASGLRDIGLSETQRQDYQLLYGLHTEGLARVYIATLRLELAAPLVDEAVSAYQKAKSRDHIEGAEELQRWVRKKLESTGR